MTPDEDVYRLLEVLVDDAFQLAEATPKNHAARSAGPGLACLCRRADAHDVTRLQLGRFGCRSCMQFAVAAFANDLVSELRLAALHQYFGGKSR